MSSLFGQNFEQCIADTPNKDVFRLGPQKLSYGDLHRSALYGVNSLKNTGLTQGMVIGVMSEDPMTLLISFLTAQYGGYVFAPMNPRLSVQEVNKMLSLCKAKLLFADPAICTALGSLDCGVPILSARLDDNNGLRTFCSLELAGDQLNNTYTPPKFGESDPALIISSSGSNGTPKCVCFSRASFAMQVKRQSQTVQIRPDDIFQQVLPLFHAGGLIGVLGSALYAGATITGLPGSFRAEKVLDHVLQEQVTVTHWIPTMLFRLAEHLEQKPADLDALRSIFFGSMPISEALLERCCALFPGRLWQTYGSTECGLMSFLLPEQIDAGNRMSGQFIQGIGVKIVDVSGHEVSIGEVGEITIPTVFAGITEYVGMPDLTAQTIHDSHVHSGDLARREAGGFFTLLDRKDALIITGGLKVVPSEVAHCFANHPQIDELAVIGVPDEEFGQSVCLVICPIAGAKPTLGELRQWSSSSLSVYKAPKKLLIINAIPRTHSGKIAYKTLRDLAAVNPD